MSDFPDRAEPDPNNGDFLSFYNLQAPRLAVYIRSAIRGAGLNEADAEDIFQETWRRLAKALKTPDRRIENPRAYSFRVLAGCIKEYVGQVARSPRQFSDDPLIADAKTLPPDEDAAAREELGETDRRRTELRQWVDRLLPTLDLLRVVLADLPRIKTDWSIPGQNGQAPARRRRGRPTKADKAHQILNDLPDQIAFLQQFLREIH